MKPIDARKLDEMLRGIEKGPEDKQSLYQKALLDSLDPSEEFLKHIEAVANATIALIKAHPDQAFGCLMSGLVGTFTLGVQAGQDCTDYETDELVWPSEIEKVEGVN